MTDIEISNVRDAVTSPAQRLVVALAATHAARGPASTSARVTSRSRARVRVIVRVGI
jgi:hypothetical protein